MNKYIAFLADFNPLTLGDIEHLGRILDCEKKRGNNTEVVFLVLDDSHFVRADTRALMIKSLFPDNEVLVVNCNDDLVKYLERFDIVITPYRIAKFMNLTLLQNIKTIYNPQYSMQIDSIDDYRIEPERESTITGRKLFCPLPVLDIIASNKLYFVSQVASYLKPQRFSHSVSVAHTSYDIAKYTSLDSCACYLAGLLHDVGKDLKIEEQRRIVNENFPAYRCYPDFALHQFVSAYIAETVFNIQSKCLSSIMYHCTGRNEMTEMEKVIYCADKVEPTRAYPTANMRHSCLRDVDDGFICVLKEHKDYFEKKGINYRECELTSQMYDFYFPIRR